MTKPTIVPFERPKDADEMYQRLLGLADRARTGEFDAIYIVATAPDHRWMTMLLGRPQSALEKVGVLETLKMDLLFDHSPPQPDLPSTKS